MMQYLTEGKKSSDGVVGIGQPWSVIHFRLWIQRVNHIASHIGG